MAAAETKTVFLTGVSGFIAKHIALQLLNAGYGVRGSVRDMARADEVKAALKPELADPGAVDERLRFVALDLGKDEGWDSAIEGADILMHTASPFPLVQPKDEESVIRPAVEGALRAFKSARQAGIRRVVMTSSSTAIMYKPLEPGRISYNESDWTEPGNPAATPYVKSKIMAEKAAWDFVEADAREMALTVIHPAFVLGPPLDRTLNTSLKVVRRFLKGTDPANPRVGFPCVDVRDIAAMHVKALSVPDSIGKRVLGSDRFLWFSDMARILKTAYPERRISTRTAPDWFIRVLSLVDPAVRTITPTLGLQQTLSAARAKELFGMQFIDAEESLLASAAALIAHGRA